MTRWSATLLVIAVCSAVVHADVTVVQKTTPEGGVAAAMGAGVPSPTVTVRIKGMTGRMDVDSGAAGPLAGNLSAIIDAATKQVILLDHNKKTASISTAGATPPGARLKTNRASAVTMKLSHDVKPTGKSDTIDGLTVDEYAFTASASLLDIGHLWEMPAVTAARERRDERIIGPDLASRGFVEDVLRDVPALVVRGSVWASKDAPGVAEYRAYQNALAGANIPSVALSATGLSLANSDTLMKALQGIDGLPVLTVIALSVDGGQPGLTQGTLDMKMTTKVLSIKTDAIGDDVFKVPDGYRIIK